MVEEYLSLGTPSEFVYTPKSTPDAFIHLKKHFITPCELVNTPNIPDAFVHLSSPINDS